MMSRIAATAPVVAALVLLLASSAREASVESPSKWDAHMIEMDVQALDTAYTQQIALLYGTWMKDYSDAVQTPRRVATGARNARNAYIHAMTQIEARRK